MSPAGDAFEEVLGPGRSTRPATERWWAHAIGALDIADWLDEAYEVGYDTLYFEYDPRTFPGSSTAGYCILARSFDNGAEQRDRALSRPEYYFIERHWPRHLRDYPQRLIYVGPLTDGPLTREGRVATRSRGSATRSVDARRLSRLKKAKRLPRRTSATVGVEA